MQTLCFFSSIESYFRSVYFFLNIYIRMHLFNLELVMKESALKLSFKRRTLYIEYQLTTTGGAHAEYRLSTAAAARLPR